jgi:hypothetical protein
MVKDWKTSATGLALAIAHVSVNGVGWRQLVTASLLAVLGFLSSDSKKSA